MHFRRLGTLLFAFVCLWAYCVFSQFLLMWIATLPEEVTWYRARLEGGWGVAGGRAGRWATSRCPSCCCCQRRIKEQPRRLAAVCAWLLLMHAVDMYWLVLPALHPRQWYPHWTSLTAWVGVGGLSVAACLLAARGATPCRCADPFLLHSLRVPQP